MEDSSISDQGVYIALSALLHLFEEHTRIFKHFGSDPANISRHI